MKSQNNRGFIRLIILILVVLIVLSYLGFDIKKIIYSPAVTKVASLLWTLILLIWKLLVSVIEASWGTIMQGLQYLIKAIQSIKTN
ncbi:MAG: hypothetical protein PHV42_00700 [Candidatus Pacebacteria bacterium]|nr:hypothetical protein [Candidatus Paceibacterota bacterium]